MGELTDDSQIFLSTVAPSRLERKLALATVLVSAALFVAAVPFAKVQLPQIWAFIPTYQSAMVINDLLTAGLLIGQYNILKTRSLLVLASGYLLTSLMAFVHTLTFPGLFAASGLLGAGPQSTAWIYMFWHAAFPLTVIAYAFLKRGKPGRLHRPGRQLSSILGAFAAVLLTACLFTVLATAGNDFLPALVLHGHHDTPAYIGVVTAVWSLSFLALAILFRQRPHSVLDQWIMVVMCAWLFDIALAAVLNQGRFDLGFYVGRAYGLVASSFVLLALTFENVKLYARVVQSLENERTERLLVQQRTAELDEANALLEERVAARTAALAASNAELAREVGERQRVEEALRRSQEELREIAAISSTAREQEKRRFARELHDELAQTLATLRLDLDWLTGREPAAGEALNGPIAEMRTLLDGAVTATRRIASDLRPLMLDDLGLVAATQWLVQNFQQRHGIECELVVDPSEWDVGEPHATAAFRIAQESLANIARHAHASRAKISLTRADDQILLKVCDNGVGFDLATPRKSNSFGLAGLRERAYLVAGELNIDTAPGRGTIIEVRIPLPAESQRAA